MSLMHREQMDCCNYFEATGNEITIDSKSNWMQLESIEGNTTQLQTTGAQLFDISNPSSAINQWVITDKRISITNPTAGYLTINYTIDVKPSTMYTLYSVIVNDIPDNNSMHISVTLLKEDGTVQDNIVILNNTSSATFTTTADTKSIYIYFRNRIIGDGGYFENIILNEGKTTVPWEPYTGGKPSPSPDYPQEIVNADIKSVTVKSAQMFDIDNPWQPYYSPQTISLTFTEPFRKVGDYADEITPTKKVSRCIEITLDGSENWSVSSSDKRFQLSGNLPVPMNRRAGFCNQYFVRTKRIENEPQLWLGIDNNDFIYIPYSQFYDESLEDKGLSLWKAHLATNPLKIITYTNPEDYVETPLDQNNIDAIKSLYAYNGVTLLNNNENTVMKVMYKSK